MTRLLAMRRCNQFTQILNLSNESPRSTTIHLTCLKKKDGATLTNYMDLLKVIIGQKTGSKLYLIQGPTS